MVERIVPDTYEANAPHNFPRSDICSTLWEMHFVLGCYCKCYDVLH